MLTINLAHRRGDFSLNIDLTVPSQGITAIFGRSGAGKSTLIDLIAGLATPQKGRIQLDGQILFDSDKRINLAPEKRRIGYVFQEHRLFPHYSVEQNLKYGYKRSNSDDFLQIIRLLGIEHLLKRFPAALSGGEKQRVAIGRALLSSPQILLMDEPLSALDLPRKQELMNYLAKLSQCLEIPILYVTHSLEEIIRLADRMILLEQGNVIAFDSVVNVWHSPQFTTWQSKSQKVSLLELPLSTYPTAYKMQGLRLGNQILWVNATPHYRLNDKVRVTICSHNVSIALDKAQHSSIRNILKGTIAQIVRQQEHMDLAVAVAEQIIWASISFWSFDELALKVGQEVYLQIKSVSL